VDVHPARKSCRHRRQCSSTGWLVNGLLLGLLAGCANSPSALEPRGPAAAQIANLWWLLLGLGTFVFLAVVAFLSIGLLRRRRDTPDEAGETRKGTRIIVWAGILAPVVILLIVFAATTRTLRVLATPERAADLTIHVIGHQWWWEVIYPQHGIETANELHIPVGQPVQIVLSTQDVIHSFWVPELHGKLDMIPGTTNAYWLQADEAGEYWGECAEFCGIQHAKMAFVVVAEPEADFTAWLNQQQQPAPAPTAALAQEGQQIFLSATCVQCHTIRGTQATGALGPDLTHLASRRTLGAGALPNTPGSLSGWIANPQHIKPGNLMPASNLTGSDLQALLAYLATLE
jgi:cytochrome c oxidase subunit 2